MLRFRHAFALAVAAALAGCERDHVEVTIDPKADGSFTRTLRLWHTSDNKKGEILPPSPGLVEQAKPSYAKALETKDAAVAFQGTFRTVPPDLPVNNQPNRGGYTIWTSPLGQLAYYRERRPGRTDHAARFREACDAADLLARYLTAVARQQLAGEQGLDRLAEFLDGPFRKDFKDALYYVDHATLCASASFTGKEPESPLPSIAAYLAQMAEERDYLQTEDVAKFRSEEGVVDLVTSLVARKMGRPLDALLRTRIAALADPKLRAEAHQAALDSLKMTDDEFERALKPITDGILHFGFGADALLHFALVLPPDADLRYTSGQADAKARRIGWEDSLDDRPVMGLYFALWATPDADWQAKHLGRVAVRGEKLQDLILWENSLAPGHAAAWRAALGRLDPRRADPKQDIPSQLALIRRPPPDQEQPEEGARILIEALKEPTP